MRELNEIQAYLYPFVVTDEDDRFVISAGTPKNAQLAFVTKKALALSRNPKETLDILEKKLTHSVEQSIILARYKEVLESTRITKTPRDEIVMVDTLMPVDKKILVVSPMTYQRMLPELIHQMGTQQKHNWKKIMEEKQNERIE